MAGLTLRDWSLQADSSQLPFAFHTVCITVLRCPCSVAMLRPVLASHTLTKPSLLPLASTALVGCQSQLLTSPPWPVIVTSDLQVGKSHTCAAEAPQAIKGNFLIQGHELQHKGCSPDCAAQATTSLRGINHITRAVALTVPHDSAKSNVDLCRLYRT